MSQDTTKEWYKENTMRSTPLGLPRNPWQIRSLEFRLKGR